MDPFEDIESGNPNRLPAKEKSSGDSGTTHTPINILLHLMFPYSAFAREAYEVLAYNINFSCISYLDRDSRIIGSKCSATQSPI
ncbi:hypothetical protein HanRHA438_Chr17g0808871 [Helianthus annuus]|nr:hypothetical protein HanRHA438_Chr17g0808871 [Helianthus annuus]